MDPTMQPTMQPQGAEDMQDEQEFEHILAGLLDYVYGKGLAGIEKQIKAAKKDVAEAIGRITFTLVSEASKQAQQAGKDIGMDVMFGVATEVIDSLIRMAEKLGKDIDPDETREDAMMVALQTFLMTTKGDPEKQEIAQQLLAEMAAEGDTDMAASELQRMGQRAGVDPFAEEGQPPKPARPSLMGGE